MRSAQRLALTLALGVVAFAIGDLVSAQSTPQQPKPGPEHEQLGYFIGTWHYGGEFRVEPEGKFSATVTCEWFSGGFHVLCRAQGSGDRGPIEELGIFGYSRVDRAFTWYAIGRTGGGTRVNLGTRQGNTWTYEWEGRVGGKPAKFRYSFTEETPTAFTYRLERSVEGGPWTAVIEAKGSKAE